MAINLRFIQKAFLINVSFRGKAYLCGPLALISTLKTQLLALSLVVIFATLQSCIPNKKLVYLQIKDSSDVIKSTTQSYDIQFKSYKIQYGDVLNIKVLSQDPMAVASFNIDQTSGPQVQQNNIQLYINGYTVDEKGYISLPIIGSVFVKDKTVTEISDQLLKEIDKYVNNATVKVKLVSYKITVLGEVKAPGVHYIYNDRASIMEVLGFAGDLTDLGNRQSVKLIRTIDKKVEVTNIDLTDRGLIQSNHFFLLPNDVLYVEPLKAKNFRLNLPAISLIVSSLTTVLVIINFVKFQ